MPAISASDLEKSYGEVRALAGASLSVDRGDLYGLLGPNGAGKTTTLAVLTGQLRPDAGRADVVGTDPTEDPVETRRMVGILPEQQTPPSFFTPREYLQFVGRIRELDAETVAERTDSWADRLGFRGKLDTLHTDLSRGQQQKVMITQAFVHEPDAVFIDEPLANLDPLVQEQVKGFLTDYVDGGNAVLLSTHNIDVAEEVCTRVGILSDGRLLAEHRVADLPGSLLEAFLDEVDAADPRDVPAGTAARAAGATADTPGDRGAEATADDSGESVDGESRSDPTDTTHRERAEGDRD